MDRWFLGGVFVFVSSCLLHSFGLVFDFGLGWDCWTRKVGSGWWHLLTLGLVGFVTGLVWSGAKNTAIYPSFLLVEFPFCEGCI